MEHSGFYKINKRIKKTVHRCSSYQMVLQCSLLFLKPVSRSENVCVSKVQLIFRIICN